MKKVIFLLLIAVFFTACRDDEPKLFKIDPSAMIYIKAKPNAQKAFMAVSQFDTAHLTPLEIVKRATGMRYFNEKLSATTGSGAAIGFAGKDTVSATPAFLRYGTDIITGDGFGVPYVVPDLIWAYDCVVEIFRSNNDIDTIAYIPNIQFENARAGVFAALNAKDTAAVYTIFNNAFSFIPITGAEYRELKRKGLQ